MSQTHSPRGAEVQPAGRARLALVLLLVLAALAWLAVYLQNRLPEVVPAEAAASEFSAARALAHLRAVAARPHPAGTRENAAVRDYILRELSNLGLAPETQRTTAVNRKWGTPFSAGTVENVLARVKGAGGGRPVLLAAHYDSAPNSPGASDDGSGVVTLLETARALKAGAPLRNDIILLFTDAEEVGLLGAHAFAAEHPWAKEVGVFLNFEARGNGGPVVMFETSGGNGDLVGQFARGAARPVANSFFYEIYQRLPNDTDFTVFKGLGAQGMNFACADGIQHYHTRLDSVEALDAGSLQHAGSNALALARHFGGVGSDGAKTTNAVYFNVLGANFIRYPGALVIPLLLLAVLLFAFVLWSTLRGGEVTFSGVALGFAGLFAAAVVALAVCWLAWWMVRASAQSYRGVPWGEPYHGNAFRVGFVLLAVAATAAVYALLRRRAGAWGLAVGALFWWLILSAVVSVMMPGGSYLFTLPLLFALAGLAVARVLKNRGSANVQLLSAIAAVPGVLLWAPMAYIIYVALTLGGSWSAVAVITVLLCGLAAPLFAALPGAGRWPLWPGLLTPAAAVCFVVGCFTNSGFDQRRPKIDHLFYALDAGSGQAVYASADDAPDAWTGQFLKGSVERGTLPEHFPGNPRAYLKSPAPAAQLAAPNLVLNEDRTEGDVRTLGFRVTSGRGAGVVHVYAEPDAEVLEASVNGRTIVGGDGGAAPSKYWGVQYYGAPAEGFDLVVRTRGGKPFKLYVVDRSYGLPESPGAPAPARPEGIIPAPFSTSDTTLVAKSFTF
ncbi:MAG TPA: M28 family peptidase [Pyrinomonadaceae bacterium]|jgi:hypothetical protein